MRNFITNLRNKIASLWFSSTRKTLWPIITFFEKYEITTAICLFLIITIILPVLFFYWPAIFEKKINDTSLSIVIGWFNARQNIIFYIILILWMYVYIYGKYVLYQQPKENKYIRINEFGRFHLILAGTCFGLISFFLGQYNDKLNLYSEKDNSLCTNNPHDYCWYSPYDILRFPINQLKYLGEHGDSLIDVQVIHSASKKDKNSFYNILLSDFSLSTEDKETEKDKHGLPFLLYQHLKEERKFRNLDSSLKKNIPLLLINEYCQSKNPTTGDSINFYFYSGLNEFRSLSRNRKSDSLFAVNGSIIKDSKDSLGPVYTSFIKESIDSSKAVMQETKNFGRTNFKFIANHLDKQIPDKQYYDKNNYVSLTIISDFLHDDSLRSDSIKIPFSEVKDSLAILFSKKAIKQINLLVIPSAAISKEQKDTHDAKINKLIMLFQYEGINLFTHKLDLYDQDLTNDIDAVNKILAITSNYEEDSPYREIYFYHPYTYFTSKHSLSSRLAFTLSDEDTSFVIGLRSSVPITDDIRLEIEKNHNARKFILALNEYKQLNITEKDIFSCNLNFNSNSIPSCDLYIDMYSINKKIKKTYSIIQRPTLPITLCRSLLFLYTLFISSLTIYLLFITVEMQRVKTKAWWIKSFVSFFSLVSISYLHYEIFSVLYIPTLWVAEDYLTAFALVSVNLLNWLFAFKKYSYFQKNKIYAG